MNRYIAGAIGGTLATVPMTLVMMGLFRQLPRSQQYPLPPREIVEVVTDTGGRRPALTNRQLTWLSLGAHFAYGAATGALYPAVARSHRPALCGAGYGVAIWALSYLGWIPAAGILRPAQTHPGKRNALMITAHLVWGAATALVSQALIQRTPLASFFRKLGF